MLKTLLLACCFGAFIANAWSAENAPSAITNESTKVQATDEMMVSGTNQIKSWTSLDRWSFQAGVAFITESTVDEIATFDGTQGKGAGQIYLMQVSYKVAQFTPCLFKHRVEIDAELPFVLGVVDEHGNDPFMQYNGGFALRWKTFPWNDWLYTNLETGVGLTYSQHVLETERARHPGRDRSHLEIYWPVQLMLAHPRLREHQLVLFLHHHSGGGTFHEGGANSLGFGYRYVPAERSRNVRN